MQILELLLDLTYGSCSLGCGHVRVVTNAKDVGELGVLQRELVHRHIACIIH